MDGFDAGGHDRGFAAQAHRADAKFVGVFGDALFQGVQVGVRVGLIEGAPEGFFGGVERRAAIAADAHAQEAGRAAFALGFVNSIHDHFVNAFQVAARVQARIGQFVLRGDVLGAAALQHQADGHGVTVHLVKMDGGEIFIADVVAGVLAGQGIHRVGAQIYPFGGFRHRGFDLTAHFPGAPSRGHVHVENRGAGILADGGRMFTRDLDVFQDGVQHAFGNRAGFLFFMGCGDGAFHIFGQAGGRQADEFQNFLCQIWLHVSLLQGYGVAGDVREFDTFYCRQEAAGWKVILDTL